MYPPPPCATHNNLGVGTERVKDSSAVVSSTKDYMICAILVVKLEDLSAIVSSTIDCTTWAILVGGLECCSEFYPR